MEYAQETDLIKELAAYRSGLQTLLAADAVKAVPVPKAPGRER